VHKAATRAIVIVGIAIHKNISLFDKRNNQKSYECPEM